jgi:DNA polymerase III epsilon subunit-like protein
MSGLEYYVVDTETTGLRSSYHEMTEIGIIRVKDRVQLHRCIKCAYPERASFDALNITKKTMSDLEKGHDKAAVVAECNKFFNEDGATPAARVIVGHNIISFDKKFLHAMWEEQGLEFPAHLWLDTIALTREFLKTAGIKTRTVNLHASCDYVGVKKLSEAHNAKVDSRNNYLLYKNLVEEKKIDYLPFIKSFPHVLSQPSDDGLDPDLLDL